MTRGWRRLTASASTLALAVVTAGLASGVALAATLRVSDPSAAHCDGVAYAPFLPTERNPNGSAIHFTPDARGHFIPVVLVHGWTGSSTHDANHAGSFSRDIDLTEIVNNTVDVGRSLVGQLQRIPGAAVFTFDYHNFSARWVDDDHLGPALGRALDCLYQSSGERAIIVAHSMGGLVARWALGHKASGGVDRVTEVSTVITFGTPEQGSILAALVASGVDGAAIADPNGTMAVVRAVLASCGQRASQTLTTGSLCDSLPAFVKAFDSDAGRALRAGSPQLRDLAPFPGGVRVVALAGDTHLKVPLGWFGAQPWSNDVPVGDVIVDRTSALAGAVETHDASCAYQLDAVQGAGDQVGLLLKLKAANEVAQPIWQLVGPCFHTNLMREIGLTNRAIGAVGDDIAARNVPTFNLDGWGGITIGMTRAQAEAAAPYPLAQVGEYTSCITLMEKRLVAAGRPIDAPEVIIDPTTNRVAAINSYGRADSRTDRGVGIGSTRAQILAAYSEPHANEETQAGTTLVITGPHGHNLSFSFDEAQRVNAIGVGPTGYAIGFELCSG